LAAYFNPAAMVRNPSGAYLGASLLMRSHCFDRRGEDGQPVAPASGFRAPPSEVCADIPPFPNPQLAVAWHFAKRWAIGLAVGGPHAHGNIEWPDVVKYDSAFADNVDHPAPNRYLLLDNNAIAVFPVLSAGFAITKQLSVGAGFVWGIASLDFSNMTEAVSPVRGNPQPDDFNNDIKANLSGVDAIVPGFVVSALWSPHRRFDVSAWYRYSDSIRAKVDLYAQSNYYTSGGQVDESAINDPANITDFKDAGTFKLPVPMEARLGFRYHHPRSQRARPQRWVTKQGGYARDGMSQDLFDIELDLTWAHNSDVELLEIRMKPGIVLNGTVDGATIPINADVPHQWKDVVGVRLGGEYVPIPDLLALRAGAFFESKGVDDEYLNLDFHLAERIGVAGGLTVRLSRFDISAAYQHTFFGGLDNGGQGKVRTVSGDASAPDYRTRQTVNGGSASSSLNEVTLGLSVHF